MIGKCVNFFSVEIKVFIFVILGLNIIIYFYLAKTASERCFSKLLNFFCVERFLKWILSRSRSFCTESNLRSPIKSIHHHLVLASLICESRGHSSSFHCLIGLCHSIIAETHLCQSTFSNRFCDLFENKISYVFLNMLTW